MPVSAVGLFSFLIGAFFAFFAPGDEDSAWRVSLGLVFFSGWILLSVVAASIVLFNRPRTLVPGHLRTQPGWIAEWRAERRTRRVRERVS
ncbi:MAG TPA: hypothetical protein VF711_12030 [Acidimicrobiales bacterium]|jgi:hypothetical protein